MVPLGPGMRRVTLAPLGPPQPRQDRPTAGHCRLVFPDPVGGALRWPRAFTYRRWHDDGRFDVDFAVHRGNGPAARWLSRAKVGDVLGWRHGGPPKHSLADRENTATALIADAAGLPVVLALVESVPAPRGIRVFLLEDARSPIPVDVANSGVEVSRFGDGQALGTALLGMRSAPPALFFAACEAGQMRRLRRIAFETFGLARNAVITSGYWKAGLTTEEVDIAKQQADWFGDTTILHP